MKPHLLEALRHLANYCGNGPSEPQDITEENGVPFNFWAQTAFPAIIRVHLKDGTTVAIHFAGCAAPKEGVLLLYGQEAEGDTPTWFFDPEFISAISLTTLTEEAEMASKEGKKSK